MAAKGRYAVAAPQPTVDEDATVEVAVDDITVVMPVTKYDRRSMHAYGETDAPEDEEEVAEDEFAPVERLELGEWRTESTLEGTHYHRKDTRLG
ncbi:MAG: hypothetical protein ABFR89_06430 [Actinomycetota bacterium]